MNQPTLTAFEMKIGYQFKDAKTLSLALTHKSFYFENRKQTDGSNEVLEFLGDAVLDLILSELLIENFPLESEGELSKKRAFLVNEKSLSEVATQLNIQDEIKLGKGEIYSGGNTKPRLLASTYEALIGSIFREAGYDKTREVVRMHFEALVDKIKQTTDYSLDYKTRFQELIQTKVNSAPIYVLKEEFGPPHEKVFVVEVQVQIQGQSRVYSMGQGKSKKQAEQDAARVALNVLAQETEGAKI